MHAESEAGNARTKGVKHESPDPPAGGTSRGMSASHVEGGETKNMHCNIWRLIRW